MRKALLPGARLRAGVAESRSNIEPPPVQRRLVPRVAIAALALAALHCGTSDPLILDQQTGVPSAEQGTGSDGAGTPDSNTGSTASDGTSTGDGVSTPATGG